MSLATKVRDNNYAHILVDEGGRRRWHLRAICSHCAREGDAPLNSGKSTLSQEWADKMMVKNNPGWFFGRRRQDDICKECLDAEREARKAETQEPVMEQIVDAPALPAPDPAPAEIKHPWSKAGEPPNRDGRLINTAEAVRRYLKTLPKGTRITSMSVAKAIETTHPGEVKSIAAAMTWARRVGWVVPVGKELRSIVCEIDDTSKDWNGLTTPIPYHTKKMPLGKRVVTRLKLSDFAPPIPETEQEMARELDQAVAGEEQAIPATDAVVEESQAVMERLKVISDKLLDLAAELASVQRIIVQRTPLSTYTSRELQEEIFKRIKD